LTSKRVARVCQYKLRVLLYLDHLVYSRSFVGNFGDMTVFSLELGIGARGQKTRVLGLPDGRKSFKIGFAV